MKKRMLFLIALVLCIPVITFAANGQPFQDTQSQIDQLKNTLQIIQRTPGPQGPQGEKGDTGLAGAAGLIGPPGVVSGITNIIRGTVGNDGFWVAGDAWQSSPPEYRGDRGVYSYHIELLTMTDISIKPTCIVQLSGTWIGDIDLAYAPLWDYDALHYNLFVESGTRGPDGRHEAARAVFAFICIQ